MAEQAQPHHQAAVQHLAYLQQAQRQLPTVGAHNPWAVQAALEAYLQQGLERQRLKSLQDLVENPPL
jgi:aspartate aminotransferase-like enzyme